MKKTIFSLAILSLVVLSSPAVAFAQTGPGTSNPTSPTGPSTNNPPATGGTQTVTAKARLENPLKGVNSIADLFYKIVDFVISFSYVVIAFFLILSGFKFVAAQGSDDKLKDAKQTFLYTIIGALIIIGAQTIIAVIKSIFSGLN